MPQSYVLLDYYGQPWTGAGAGTYTNYGVDQPLGIFAVDAQAGDKNAHLRVLGSLGAYVLPTDTYKASQTSIRDADGLRSSFAIRSPMLPRAPTHPSVPSHSMGRQERRTSGPQI